MKNVFKKGLVVLLASVFASTVFAAEMTATGMDNTKPAVTTTAPEKAPAHKKMAKHHHKKAMKKCMHNCKKNHGKHCKKHCKAMHHQVAMKANDASPAATASSSAANAQHTAAAPAAEQAQG